MSKLQKKLDTERSLSMSHACQLAAALDTGDYMAAHDIHHQLKQHMERIENILFEMRLEEQE